jgi:hypothetical protein
MKSIKTFSLCLALCLIGFVQAAGAQTNQPSTSADDSKASCCSTSCCAGGVCHLASKSKHQHATAQAARAHATKDGCDCCAQCDDCCKSGGDGSAAQSCTTCKMGAHRKSTASHHADASMGAADCCAGCTCCAAKDATQ